MCDHEQVHVGRGGKRSGKVNRIATLFEIPRPSKSDRTLKRSTSLPISSRRPDSFSMERNDRDFSTIDGKHLQKGRVKRIKEQIENSADVSDEVLYFRSNSEDSNNVSEMISNGTVEAHPEELLPSIDETTTTKRLYLKRTDHTRHSKRSPHKKSSKELIVSRETNKGLVKEKISQFENFIEAEQNGETESFRKSIVMEMDMEMENMKLDGFEEDFHISDENLDNLEREYENNRFDEFETNAPDTEVVYDDPAEFLASGEIYYTPDVASSINSEVTLENRSDNEDPDESIFDNVVEKENDYKNMTAVLERDDEFGETSFGEDLENGLYFLETYNADGKELVIVSMQIDRKVVDMDNLDEVQSTSKMLIQQNRNNTWVLVDLEASVSQLSLNDSSDSKRTTIYSTTSGESFDDRNEDDECFGLGQDNYNYVSARRETFCDKQGIVRIERVAYPEHIAQTPQQNGRLDDELPEYEYITYNGYEDAPEAKKETLFYIMDEIKVTERKYVGDLEKIIEDYKPYIEQHTNPQVSDKAPLLFGNIADLHAKQVEFLEAIEDSENNINELIQAFIDFEDLFRLYPKYFRSKLKANVYVKELASVIKERQEQLNDKLDLSAYLLTPLQRLGKYKLFLENIIKQLEKENQATGFANMALDIIKKQMSRGNDAVAASSILNSPLHWRDYGSFIMRQKFTCLKPKRLDLMVFLFEEVVVFALEDQRNMDEFIYWQSVKTNDLRIATFEDTTLHLTDYTKTKRRNSSKYTYVLDAKTQKVKENWRKEIEDILWKQLMKAKENTLKLYQSDNRKKSKAKPKINRERIKSAGASIFYID